MGVFQSWQNWLNRQVRTQAASNCAVYVSGSSVASAQMVLDTETNTATCRLRADHIETLASFGPTLAQQRQSLGFDKAQPVNLVLAPELYTTSLVAKPDVPQDEVVEAAKWVIQEQIDYPVDEAVIDTFPVPDAARDSDSIFVVSMPKARLSALIESAQASQVSVGSVDVSEMAIRNLCWHSFPMADQSVALLRLTGNSGLITVSRGDELYVARRILGVPEEFNEGALESFKEQLLLQVQRSLDYYESAMGQPTCDLLMVACTHNWTSPLTTYLSEALPTPVRTFADAISGDLVLSMWNPDRIEVDWEDLSADQENALVAALPALGGALRSAISSALMEVA